MRRSQTFFSISRIGFPLVLAFAVVTLILHPLPGLQLASHLRNLLAGLIPFLVGWPFGLILLGNREKKGLSIDLERGLLALGLGQGFLYGLTFLLLTFHLLYAAIIPILAAGFILPFLRKWQEILRKVFPVCESDELDGSPSRSVMFFLACSGILALACALLPPTNYDALEYHLVVPETWLAHHAWASFPNNIYAWFPMNIELLYLWGLVLGDTPAATIIEFLFMMACAAVVWALGKRRGGGDSGWLAVILFVSSGLVMSLAIQADIDLGVCFYSLLALLAFVRWREGEDQYSLILSAVFVGIGLGCKYIAIISSWIPMLVLVLLAGRGGQRRRGFLWMLFLPIGVVLPWLARNGVMVGNPVFPLLYRWFGGDGWTAAADTFFRAAHSPKPIGLSAHLIQFIRLPVDLTIRDLNTFSPLILAGVVLSVICLSRDRLVRILLGFSSMVLALWFVFTQRNHRFLVTIAPSLALVAAWGLGHGGSWLRRPVRWPIWLVSYWSLYLFLAVLSASDGMNYLVGGQSVPQYYERLLPHMRAIHYLNEENSKRRIRVLFVGEAQAYGRRCDAIVPVVFNPHPWVKHNPSGKAIPQTSQQAAHRLWELGVTHILYNESELNRLSRGYVPLGWPDGAELKRLIHLLDGIWLRTVFQTENGIIKVFEVRPYVETGDSADGAQGALLTSSSQQTQP